jgi:hypothetical protein
MPGELDIFIIAGSLRHAWCRQDTINLYQTRPLSKHMDSILSRTVVDLWSSFITSS